jgi:outer membrane immunogenic protein
MKHRTLAIAAALAMTLAADVAGAADFPTGLPYTAPGPVSGYSWTGPYLGGNLGYLWGDTTRNPTNPSGIAGGVHGGYNWQTGQFVFGGEADISATNASDTFASWKFSNRWFSTIRGRVGYALNNILFYGTGGLAFGDGRVDAGGLTEGKTHFGWTAGVGMEVGLTSNLSARVEYLFVDLADKPYALTGTSNGFTSSLLRVGFSYRF